MEHLNSMTDIFKNGSIRLIKGRIRPQKPKSGLSDKKLFFYRRARLQDDASVKFTITESICLENEIDFKFVGEVVSSMISQCGNNVCYREFSKVQVELDMLSRTTHHLKDKILPVINQIKYEALGDLEAHADVSDLFICVIFLMQRLVVDGESETWRLLAIPADQLQDGDDDNLLSYRILDKKSKSRSQCAFHFVSLTKPVAECDAQLSPSLTTPELSQTDVKYFKPYYDERGLIPMVETVIQVTKSPPRRPSKTSTSSSSSSKSGSKNSNKKMTCSKPTKPKKSCTKPSNIEIKPSNIEIKPSNIEIKPSNNQSCDQTTGSQTDDLSFTELAIARVVDGPVELCCDC